MSATDLPATAVAPPVRRSSRRRSVNLLVGAILFGTILVIVLILMLLGQI